MARRHRKRDKATVSRDERVSLHPLEFEEALKALLTVDPDEEVQDDEGGDNGDRS